MYFQSIVITNVPVYFDIMYKCLTNNVLWCIITTLFQLLLCTNYEKRTEWITTDPQSTEDYKWSYSQGFPIRNHSNKSLLQNEFISHIEASKTSNCNTRECCKKLISLSLIGFDQNKDDFETYDGMSKDDIVRDQYKLLPYPPVPEEELKKEEQFYLENKFRMYHNYNFLDLESLNHHLYRGQNDFR